MFVGKIFDHVMNFIKRFKCLKFHKLKKNFKNLIKRRFHSSLKILSFSTKDQIDPNWIDIKMSLVLNRLDSD